MECNHCIMRDIVNIREMIGGTHLNVSGGYAINRFSEVGLIVEPIRALFKIYSQELFIIHNSKLLYTVSETPYLNLNDDELIQVVIDVCKIHRNRCPFVGEKHEIHTKNVEAQVYIRDGLISGCANIILKTEPPFLYKTTFSITPNGAILHNVDHPHVLSDYSLCHDPTVWNSVKKILKKYPIDAATVLLESLTKINTGSMASNLPGYFPCNNCGRMFAESLTYRCEWCYSPTCRECIREMGDHLVCKACARYISVCPTCGDLTSIKHNHS